MAMVVQNHQVMAWVSSGVISSTLRAAMASFALWMTYSLAKASSPGQFNFLDLPRMVLKKFSKCGMCGGLLNDTGISNSASCAVSRTSTLATSDGTDG